MIKRVLPLPKCNFLLTLAMVSVAWVCQAQTVNWVGSVSSSYGTSANWDVSTFNPLSPTGSETVVIGAGNPYNPIHTGGSSNRRVARLNTLPESQFTVQGILYPNNSDFLNGNIIVEGNADFNIRNNVIIGSGNAGTVTVLGGSLTSRNVLFVGRYAGGNGTLNIWGGKVNAGTDLQVGANGGAGAINFRSVGMLTVPGNKVTFLQGLVAARVITVDGDRELDIVFDATKNTTQASIKQDPNSLLKEYADYVVLENGTVSMTIKKANAEILSYKYKGFEMLTDGYYSMDGGTTYAQPSNCKFTTKVLTDDIADVSFKSTWTSGLRAQALDIDIHMVLERSGSGVYSYALLSHPASYPATGVGEWRMVWKLNQDQVENLYVDDLRHMQMPNAADIAVAQATGIAEAIKITSGVKNGQYECKYNYSVEYEKVGTYGHASNVNKVGSWLVFGGFDYFNDGPTKQDLSAALGIIHVHFGRNHYNGSSTTVAEGEQWSKIYGPFMLYVNANEAGADACWADAKAKASEEAGKWPYAWLTNTPEYPAASQRGAVTGKFIVSDSFKPNITGGNAMIGLAQPDPGGNWQFESKRYQYWVKANTDGTFTIPHVRPGTYTLYAFTDGEVGEYRQDNVVVSSGSSTIIGDVVWEIQRNKGKLQWEIGIPDRTAKEFKHGNDYFQPFLWLTYSQELSNPLIYTVGQSNWATDWNYAQSAYWPNESTLTVWPWKVNFNVSNLPENGNATLTLAFAGSDHARMDIYANDDPNLISRFYPDMGGGNALVRQGVHAKYSVATVQIPVSKLRLGMNTLTLIQGRATSSADHLMYDYLSFEMAENHIPEARLTASALTGYSPLNVLFDGSASYDEDSTTLTYAWDFGDGTTATTDSITHTYTSPGNYLARLIVTDTRGAADTVTTTIHVRNNLPVARLTTTATLGNAPLVVTFNASTSFDIDRDSLTFSWNFGDGTFGTGSTISHSYAHGHYRASLVVADTRGGVDTVSVSIQAINNAPVAAFTASPPAGYAPLPVRFDATATRDIDQDSLNYAWNFGDGTLATGVVTEHTYASPGTYKVTLSVFDAPGAADSTTLNIIAASGLKVQYKTKRECADALTGSINPDFKIVNTSTRPVPYSDLAIRYWYTKEGRSNQQFKCAFAALGTSKVAGNIVPMTTPADSADYYVEITFTSTASIPAGGNSGPIETIISKQNRSYFDQRDDYSFNPRKRTFEDWSHVTLYRNGKLFWGVEPKSTGNLPAPTPGEGVPCSLYPNPSHGIFYVNGNLTERGDVNISVYNLVGVRVMHEALGSQPPGAISHALEATSLPPGTYYVRVVLADQTYVSILVKY